MGVGRFLLAGSGDSGEFMERSTRMKEVSI